MASETHVFYGGVTYKCCNQRMCYVTLIYFLTFFTRPSDSYISFMGVVGNERVVVAGRGADLGS